MLPCHCCKYPEDDKTLFQKHFITPLIKYQGHEIFSCWILFTFCVKCSFTDVINSLRNKRRNNLFFSLDSHTMCYLAFLFQKCLLNEQIPRNVPAHLALVCHCSAAFWRWLHDWSFCFMTKPAHSSAITLWSDNEMGKHFVIGINCHHNYILISQIYNTLL